MATGQKPTYHVIHIRGDGGEGRRAEEGEECELETALEEGCTIIVVEPMVLGQETVGWIRMGNFLHKSAVLASLTGLVSLPCLPGSVARVTALPLGLFGVCCAFLYDVSWQFDPCCKYQVDYHGHELAHVPSHELHSRTPVVLIRKNDKYRRRLHNGLALLFLSFLGWKLYQHFSGCSPAPA